MQRLAVQAACVRYHALIGMHDHVSDRQTRLNASERGATVLRHAYIIYK